MSYQMSRCIPLWFGQLKGHMEAVQTKAICETVTYSEKYEIESSLISIKSNCDAIIKQLNEAKEIK